jgi:carboxylate-amine ligase
VTAFTEYVHALVLDLATRYEDGESGTDVRRELLDENKWRAMRHGREASFVTPDDGDVVDLATHVDTECDRLGVSGLRDLLDADSGAARQRRVHETEGMDALCRSLLL